MNYIKRNIFGCAGAALILLGYYYNANEMSVSWLLWIVGNAFMGIYSMSKEAYPTAVLSFTLVFMSVYGYLSWV